MTTTLAPIYDPNGRWCVWNINEIYTGFLSENLLRYVPKINDFVEDTAQAVTYKVTAVNPVTLLSTLEQVRTYGLTTPLSEDDILTGVGPGTQSDTYRVYIDTSVVPYVLAVDARLKVAGTLTSTAKIFKGTNVEDGAQVVGFLFDQSGNVTTQNIPLELAASTGNNYTIKNVAVCYTNENLPNGEVVTVVLFSDTGNVISKRQCLIENTSFIRGPSVSQKFISHISLKSPFLSNSNDHVLEYPLNVPVNAFNLIGRVHYNDGTISEHPVDGTKFKIHGLETFISTVPGQQYDLVLSYSLGTNEAAYGAITGDGKFITEPYSLTTVAKLGAYTVKLFVYPEWIDSINGYRLKWYMYNLDRNIFYDVSPLVTFNSNSVFNPILYGTLQHLSVRINLRDVTGAFKSYIHVQNVDLVLRNQGTQRTTNWTVLSDPAQTQPYGDNVFAKASMVNQNLWHVKVDSGYTTLQHWLENIYINSKPLFDHNLENVLLTPNYFIIQVGNQSYEFPIDAWNDELTIGGALAINKTLIVRFIKRTNNADLQLSVAGMAIWDY